MARMPKATWLGEHSPGRPMVRHDIVCVHTIVGFAPAHAAHFSVKADGTILQSRDTRFQSGANLNGNRRVIAIENEDHGRSFGDWNTSNGHAVPALTFEQVEGNAEILAWAHRTHGIPLRLALNSRPTSRGLAYHRQGIDGDFSDFEYPGRVSGGEVWSEARGKVCPGDRKIDQRHEILTRAIEIVNGVDMTKLSQESLDQIRRLVREEIAKAGDTIRIDHDDRRGTPKWSLATTLRWIRNTAARRRRG